MKIHHNIFHIIHDLKAPLRSLSSLQYLISNNQNNTLDQESKDYLSLSFQLIQKMQNTITQIIHNRDFDDQDKAWTLTNINHLFCHIHSLFLPQLIEKKGRLLFKKNHPLLHIKYHSIHQILENIIQNSILHQGKKNLRIKIKFRKTRNTAFFTITDNGKGMLSQDILHINQNKDLDSQPHHKGIGLKCILHNIKNLGGHLTIRNNSKVGMTLCFSCPLMI